MISNYQSIHLVFPVLFNLYMELLAKGRKPQTYWFISMWHKFDTSTLSAVMGLSEIM